MNSLLVLSGFRRNVTLLLFIACSTMHISNAQPVVNGDLSEGDYSVLATKGNPNLCFGGGKDVSKILYCADLANQQLYIGIAGKLVNGSNDGIGLWLNFSNLVGATQGTNLGGTGGHYMGDPSNPNFKADFEVDYMFAMNPGGSGNPMYVDVVKKVGGTTVSYLGNCGLVGVAISGPGTSGVFGANSVQFAFDNSGTANTGFEIRIPFSELGVNAATTLQAFAFVVSSTAYFSDVTVPGNVSSGCLGINPNFATVPNGPYHSTSNPSLPVQLTVFSARVLSEARVQLDWRTISEVNNYGFYVERRAESGEHFVEVPNSFVAGHGTTNEPQDYSFTDNVAPAGQLQYRLKQVDLDGTIHFTEPINVSSPTSVKEDAPKVFSLKQNYPNPFNPSTEIKFSVETSQRTSLKVYDMLGKEVALLFDEIAEPGQYYSIRFDGAHLASGMYFYRLTSGKQTELKKLVLLK